MKLCIRLWPQIFRSAPLGSTKGWRRCTNKAARQRANIVGHLNWRLPGLQETIRAGRLPKFEDLCATTTDQFYHHDQGANYGQARYLCYYLQEQGLLKKFYDDFRANVKRDPTGYKTLQAVLKESDMDDFQKRWEAWVLKLKRS